MKNYTVYCFVLVQLVSASPDWTFEDAYDDEMLYLHALINYQFDQRWYDRWESNLFAGNGFLLSVGSVTVDDLLIDGHLVLNIDLGAGWRFQGDGRWLETRHLNTWTRDTFMGLEKLLSKNFSLFMNVTPFYNKEFTDIRTGFSIYNDDKTNYLRLGFKIDDFVYDDKNQFGAVTEKSPLGLEWHSRYQWEYLTVYTTGMLGTGYGRSFQDRNKSPDMTYHAQRINRAEFKVYASPLKKWLFGSGIYYYTFIDKKSYVDERESYIYENRMTDWHLEINYDLHPRHGIRNISHIVWQTAGSRGYRAHDYDRTDVMTGLFYLLHLKRHTIEAGYMFTLVDWSYSKLYRDYDRAESSYLDKLKLAWYYRFPNNAELNISVSHQVSIGGFGGANLQYIMLF